MVLSGDLEPAGTTLVTLAVDYRIPLNIPKHDKPNL